MNKRYKYQEVAERIKMDIFVNYQAPSKPIPSIREYAEVNQVNPHTVACALRLLMESQFLALDPSDIIAYRKRDFQLALWNWCCIRPLINDF